MIRHFFLVYTSSGNATQSRQKERHVPFNSQHCKEWAGSLKEGACLWGVFFPGSLAKSSLEEYRWVGIACRHWAFLHVNV